MALSVSCFCGVEIDFQPEDRGFEVYCPSCGRAVPVPSDQDGSPARRTSVFCAEGEMAAARQVVGHVTCLCETRIPIRPEDFGGAVYCPSCGAEVCVGAALNDVERAVGVVRRPPDESTASPSVSRPRRRLVSWHGAAACAALVGFVIFAVRWTRQSSGSLSAGLMLPSQEALAPAVEARAAPSDELASEAASEPAESDPLADVTLQAIDALLEQDDAAAALMQAQIWQELLRNYEFPADDPRPARLAEAIEKLMRKLAPPPEVPPPCVKEFSALLRELARVLQAKDVDVAKARRLVERCERMLEQHPEALRRAAPMFYTLKSKLRDAELKVEGVRTVDRLIEQVRALAEQGKVTEALESNAQAKFLFVRCDMSREDEDRLDGRARELIPILKLARAKRYVQDARALVKIGDAEARDRVVAAARRILQQELEESTVRPLLVELKECQDAKSTGSGSAQGREMLSRDEYEDLLDHFGRVKTASELAPFIEKCVAFHDRWKDSDQAAATSDRVAALAFDLLEFEVNMLSRLPDSHTDLADQLSLFRRVLDQMGPWRDSPRWQALDATIQQRGSSLAQIVIDQAVALAKSQKLAEAVSHIGPAVVLGNESISQRAKKMREQWQAEIELRASLEAQDKGWARIHELLGQPQLFEAWRELNLFAERFPTGKYTTESAELRDRLRPQLQALVGSQLDELDRLHQQENWGEFRSKIALLDPSLVSDAHRPRWENVQKQTAQLSHRAAQKFAELRQHKQMTNEADILRVLDGAARILAMDPEHAEAAKLLEQAEQRRLQRVEMLTKMLKSYKAMPAKYREKLEEIIRLDPDGPHGSTARELLKATAG